LHSQHIVDSVLANKPVSKMKKNKRHYLINSPKDDQKKSQPTSGGVNRDSVFLVKEMASANERNKSVNFPSYYKGGSAATHERRLKEAAIQMLETRLTKTTHHNRLQNVSPFKNNSKPASLMTPADFHKPKKSAKKNVSELASAIQTSKHVLPVEYQPESETYKTHHSKKQSLKFEVPLEDFQRMLFPDENYGHQRSKS